MERCTADDCPAALRLSKWDAKGEFTPQERNPLEFILENLNRQRNGSGEQGEGEFDMEMLGIDRLEYQRRAAQAREFQRRIAVMNQWIRDMDGPPSKPKPGSQ